MQTIYKYPLKLVESQEISLPDNHQILDIQLQNGIPCVWILLDKDDLEPSKRHRFYFSIFGTGEEFNASGLKFIKTLQLDSGLVFHFFWKWTSR